MVGFNELRSRLASTTCKTRAILSGTQSEIVAALLTRCIPTSFQPSLPTAAQDMDAVALLDPFLEVIQSGDTNGPITGAALTSVEKFLMYKIISTCGLP